MPKTNIRNTWKRVLRPWKNPAGREMLLVVLLLAIGFLVRTVAFGSIPAGMNQDETSTAYDAFAILQDGMDRNGIRLPAVLISWGSGMNALSAYASIPFIVLFGLNEVSARLPNLLSALLTLVLFYLLARQVAGRHTALLALFLLAITPWHVMLARWGVDENFFPFVFTVGMYCLVRSCEQPRWFIAACAAFGLSLYAHGASYFVVPVFIVPATIFLLLHRKVRFTRFLAGWTVLMLLALPHLLYLAVNHFRWQTIVTPFLSIPRLTGIPRYETVSTIFSGAALRLVKDNLAGLWLFLQRQSDGAIWNEIDAYGIVYRFSMPLILLGILLTIARRYRIRRFHPEHLMVLWLLAGIALAAVLPVNVNRMNVLYLPLVFFIAVAIEFLHQKKFVYLSVLVLYLFSFGSFTRYYFTRYAADIGPVFFASFGDAIKTATNATDGTICVTDGVTMPYIYVLFYNQIDPEVYRRTAVIENPGAEFQYVRSFDRYVFGLRNCMEKDIAAYVLNKGELDLLDSRYRVLRSTDRYDVAVRLDYLALDRPR